MRGAKAKALRRIARANSPGWNREDFYTVKEGKTSTGGEYRMVLLHPSNPRALYQHLKKVGA